MTPKQKYDERKRLRIERDLRDLNRSKDHAEREDDMTAKLDGLYSSFARIADVMELWADMQASEAQP